MIKTNYSEDFEEFWRLFDLVVESGLGQKGNKKRAYKRYLEKQIGPEDFGLIREAIERQVRAKQFLRGTGRFDPDFMHVEGWINNERWDDEFGQPGGAVCESDRRKEAALRNYLQGDMGEGVVRVDRTKAH